MSNKEVVQAIENAFLLKTLVDYWHDKDEINSDNYDVFSYGMQDNISSNAGESFFPYY